MKRFENALVSGSLLGLIAIGALASCTEDNNTPDASDVVRRDAVQTDVGNEPDVQTYEDAGNDGDDAAPTDAATCSSTGFDPRDYTFSRNHILVGRSDATDINPAYTSNTNFEMAINTMAAVEPDAREGSCVYTRQFYSGSLPWNASPDVDLGPISITQGAKRLDLVRNTAADAATNGQYLTNPNAPTATPLAFEQPLVLQLGNADAGTGMMFSNVLPTGPTTTTFPLPETLSRTTNNVLPFTPPTNATADLAAVVWLWAPRYENQVVCVVPACAGTVTVPASMVARYPAATVVNVITAFWRNKKVTLGGQSVNFGAVGMRITHLDAP